MKIVPIWVLMLIPLYLFVTNFAYVHSARELTENVIRDPEVPGLTVNEYDGPNIFSAYTEAIYSFNDRESMFIGLSKLCQKFTSLGWKYRSRTSCEGEIRKQAKLDIDTLSMHHSNTFCVREGLKVTIYYTFGSVRKVYPWSVEVQVMTKRHTAMCK